jgi:hypothetical protein
MLANAPSGAHHTQEDEMTETATHTGNPTNESEKARQAAIIASTGTPVEGTKVTRFDRFTANVAMADCRNIHPNGHITPENAELCGIDRAVELFAELTEAGIDPEAIETATTVTIHTFDRFWCGRDDHPFGHGTVQTAKHGTNRAAGTKQAKAAIQVKRAGKAVTPQSRTLAPKQDAPATPAQTTPKASKLRSGAEGTVGGQANRK